MTKLIKIILPAVTPILVLAIVGLLYMWREQAVQNEKLISGFNRIEQRILSQEKMRDLKFSLLRDDLKRVGNSINDHEKEDRRLITAIFERINQ